MQQDRIGGKVVGNDIGQDDDGGAGLDEIFLPQPFGDA